MLDRAIRTANPSALTYSHRDKLLNGVVDGWYLQQTLIPDCLEIALFNYSDFLRGEPAVAIFRLEMKSPIPS